MKIPRDISGRHVAKVLVQTFGYRVVHERESHIVLETDDPSHHRVAVPDHRALRIGTLNAILRAVSIHKGVARQSLLDKL